MKNIYDWCLLLACLGILGLGAIMFIETIAPETPSLAQEAAYWNEVEKHFGPNKEISALELDRLIIAQKGGRHE